VRLREPDGGAPVRDGAYGAGGSGGSVPTASTRSGSDRSRAGCGLDGGPGDADEDRASGGQSQPSRLALARGQEQDGSRGRGEAGSIVVGQSTAAGQTPVEGGARMAVADPLSPVAGDAPHDDQEHDPCDSEPTGDQYAVRQASLDERWAQVAGESGPRGRRSGEVLDGTRSDPVVAGTVGGGAAAASRGGVFDRFGGEAVGRVRGDQAARQAASQRAGDRAAFE